MKGKADALLDVAMSVADGSVLGWRELEAQPPADLDRAVLHQLRIVARIAAVHKSQADSVLTNGEAPARWGSFLLMEQLGNGAFGDVYLARDTQLDRLVAIKLLRPRDDSEPGLLHRMLREARALARVRHQNVVTVYGAEARDGFVGLSMEFVRGLTMDEVIEAEGPLSAIEAAVIGMDLCRALTAVHEAGLVHGDVKAQNVMREDGGRLVLMDFGSGQMPHEPDAHRPVTGTPLYVAPEVLNGGPATVQSDIYSAGVLLYRLVTARYPIHAAELAGVHDAHEKRRVVSLETARPGLPDAFCRAVGRALDPDPARRPETAAALQADLARAFDLPVDLPSATAITRRAGPARVFDLHRRTIMLGVIVLTALATVAGVRIARRADARVVQSASSIRSIAVLPLANLSAPADAYLADGMTDELIATLGRVSTLRVTSWPSVRPFRNSEKPVGEIGRALNVDAILKGTVTVLDRGPTAESRRRARVTTQLVLAGTGNVVWSESFDRDVADTLGVRGDIARAVAREIRRTLSPRDEKVLAPSAVNAAAQDAYLKGRYLLDQYESTSLAQARTELETAVAADPSYARAWSALSRAYVMLELAGALPRSDARALAMRAAERALDLDDTLPSAHANLAELNFYYDWDWQAAERGYQRALELNPSDTLSRSDYARLLAAEGRLAEALREARQARELDPLSPYATSTVGMMLYYARRYDEAVGELQEGGGFFAEFGAPLCGPRPRLYRERCVSRRVSRARAARLICRSRRLTSSQNSHACLRSRASVRPRWISSRRSTPRRHQAGCPDLRICRARRQGPCAVAA